MNIILPCITFCGFFNLRYSVKYYENKNIFLKTSFKQRTSENINYPLYITNLTLHHFKSHHPIQLGWVTKHVLWLRDIYENFHNGKLERPPNKMVMAKCYMVKYNIGELLYGEILIGEMNVGKCKMGECIELF